MDAIQKARELGKIIQEDSRYTEFYEAAKENDDDTELQNMIGEFNVKRMELNQEMSKEEKDADKMTSLDDEIKELYGNIMSNPSMAKYNTAKDALDKMLQAVNYIINMAANGEDPLTCPEEAPHSCSGSCSSCGGCH